jgi:hypothetical protein
VGAGSLSATCYGKDTRGGALSSPAVQANYTVSAPLLTDTLVFTVRSAFDESLQPNVPLLVNGATYTSGADGTFKVIMPRGRARLGLPADTALVEPAVSYQADGARVVFPRNPADSTPSTTRNVTARVINKSHPFWNKDFWMERNDYNRTVLGAGVFTGQNMIPNDTLFIHILTGPHSINGVQLWKTPSANTLASIRAGLDSLQNLYRDVFTFVRTEGTTPPAAARNVYLVGQSQNNNNGNGGLGDEFNLGLSYAYVGGDNSSVEEVQGEFLDRIAGLRIGFSDSGYCPVVSLTNTCFTGAPRPQGPSGYDMAQVRISQRFAKPRAKGYYRAVDAGQGFTSRPQLFSLRNQ